MRFTLYLQPPTSGPRADQTIFDSLARQARDATAAGFAGVCLTEHHANDYNTYTDSFMLGAYLAPQLPPDAYTVLAIVPPPLYHPIRLAEQCNLLDLATHGRCIIGFGPGGSPVEYAVFGASVQGRHERMMNRLDLMLAALTKDADDPPLRYEVDGFPGSLDFRVNPSSYRQPYPMFARASSRDESILDTAGRGWVLLTSRLTPPEFTERFAFYETALRQAGHPERLVRFCLEWTALQRMVFIADTDEEAREQVLDLLECMGGVWRRSAGPEELLRSIVPPGQESNAPLYPVMPADRWSYVRRAMLVGSPATVAAQVRELAEAGVRHVTLQFPWGYTADERAERTFRRFLEEVLPQFPRPDETGLDWVDEPAPPLAAGSAAR